MNLGVAEPAKQLKVVEVERYVRVADIIRSQVDFVVDDLARNVNTVSKAAFT